MSKKGSSQFISGPRKNVPVGLLNRLRKLDITAKEIVDLFPCDANGNRPSAVNLNAIRSGSSLRTGKYLIEGLTEVVAYLEEQEAERQEFLRELPVQKPVEAPPAPEPEPVAPAPQEEIKLPEEPIAPPQGEKDTTMDFVVSVIPYLRSMDDPDRMWVLHILYTLFGPDERPPVNGGV